MIYAELSGSSPSTVINILVADETWPAANPSNVYVDINNLSPQPGIGWTYDGTNWAEPTGPPDPNAQYIATASDTIDSLLGRAPAYLQQIQADAALFAGTTVGSTLTAEHLAALTRMVDGFSTLVAVLTAHMVLTNTVPADTISQIS